VNTEISYDQLISKFLDERIEGEDSIWRQASYAFFMKEQMQVPAPKIASDVGYSSRYINELAKTFRVFPTEETRARDMSFSIHAKCASSDDPEYWLDQACANAYSVKELGRAMKGDDVDGDDELSNAMKLWEKVVALIESGGDGSQYIKEQIEQLYVPTDT